MRPAALTRFAVALCIGTAAALACANYMRLNTPVQQADITFWWQGARMWLAGGNPYAAKPFTPDWPLNDRLLYPLTALITFAPLSWLSLPAAAGAFIGLSCAWLAWLLLGEGEWWRLLLFVSPSAWMAVRLGQWAPLLTAAMLVPIAGWFLAAKPTLGAALFVSRPSWRAAGSALAAVVVSFVVWPSWAAWWLHNVRSVPQHSPPILTSPISSIALLALLRWRTREGRLVAGMACVPQLLMFYDQLPLLLVAQTRREALWLSLSGLVTFALWLGVAVAHSREFLRLAAPYVLAGTYLPALVIVLVRRERPSTERVRSAHGDARRKV